MDNFEKIQVFVKVSETDREEAEAIVAQAKVTDGDDTVFIAELERLLSTK